MVQDPFFVLDTGSDITVTSVSGHSQYVCNRFMCWGVNVSGCLDDGVEQHDSRLLGDDLFGGEVMLDELRDGGEAGAFKPVLTLPERERERDR